MMRTPAKPWRKIKMPKNKQGRNGIGTLHRSEEGTRPEDEEEHGETEEYDRRK
jgi:hypothetical protein